MGVISIKRSIDQLEDVRSRAEASLEAYRRILLALERAAAIIAGEDTTKLFQEHLEVIRLQLNLDTPPATVAHGGETVEKELEGFAHQRAYVRDQKEWEYKQIIRIVAEAGAIIAQGGSSDSQELIELATKIDTVSRLENIAEVRKQLSDRVTEIKTLASRVHEEGNTRAHALEGKVRSIEERLQAAERLAETDSLTGLGNRRMAETTMHAAISSGTPFSLILCDLNNFKSVNDRYGHLQGDQLLKSVGQAIKNAVRESDVVCRWGGDEFVVLLKNAPLANAEMRASAIEKNAFGEFLVKVQDTESRIKVSASVGVAEYRASESAFDFFERADQLMYAKKFGANTTQAANGPAVEVASAGKGGKDSRG